MKQIIPTFLRAALVICICCLFMGQAKAQYFTIPDTGLVTWFNNNGYSSCLTGNQLDTTCSVNILVTQNTLSFANYGIADFTGLRYLRWYTPNVNFTFDLSHNRLTSLQPELLEKIGFSQSGYILDYNFIDTLNIDQLQPLSVSATHNGMHTVIANNPQVGNLFLTLDYNNLDSLYVHNLGNYVWISIRHNLFTHIPATLQCTVLNCGANMIDSISPSTPYYNQLTCDSNNLRTLYGYSSYINCSHNQITSLTHTNFAQSIICDSNHISTLDISAAIYVNANTNNLSSITTIGTGATYLNVNNNPLLQCIPSLPNSTGFELDFVNTAIACLPRQYAWCTYTGTPAINSVPTCNLFNNVNGCPQYANLGGYTYFDTLPNCTFSAVEPVLPYVKALVSTGGTVQQQIYSDNSGHYSFNEINYGNYTLTVDTTGLPFSLQCPDTLNYVTTVDSQKLYQNNFNFGFNCKPGFDVGIYGLANNTWFHPGSFTTVNLMAGDMTAVYGMHCASGVSGQVTLSFFGPVHYAGVQGGLTPSTISNSSLTWNIADFGAVDPYTAFNVLFTTDTTATNFEPVCLSAHVSPTVGDNNPLNNDAQICSQVVIAFDPNGKEVYPAGKIDTTQKWLTYNIHFQNTGSASATNVYILDTLDTNLDPLSFKLSGFDHQNVTQVLPGGIVQFNFPFINLPDTTASFSGSTGYIQYQVKQKPNLPAGTIISNRASIYFDYNAPVQTNAARDTIKAPVPACAATYDTLTRAICQGDSVKVGNYRHTTAGSFTDTISNAAGCDSVVSLRLTVNPLPVVTFSLDSMVLLGRFRVSQGDTFVCENQLPVQLAGGGPADGYYGGTGIQNGVLYLSDSVIPGPKLIAYQRVDSNGCYNYAAERYYLDICEDVQNINANATITLYPNPATDQLYIKTENIQPVTTTVYDADGRMIFTKPFAPVVDVNTLSSGVYFVEVKSDEGVIRKRFIKM